MDRDYTGDIRLNGMPVGQGGFGKRRVSAPTAELGSAAQQFVREYREERSRPAEIDFTIKGHDVQYVEIELDPGEAVIAENGAMIWKDSDIDLAMVAGDNADENAGLLGKAGAAVRAGVAGESLAMSQFRHNGSGRKARLALGGQTPGHVAAIRLEDIGGTIVCRRDSFLAAAQGARISARLQDRAWSGMLGGEGLVMQTITGTGWAFFHIGGTLIERELEAGEMIHVDSGCHVAHLPSVDMNIRMAGGIGVVVAGNEGLLMTTLRGPGKVWIQTLQPRPQIAPVALVSGGTVGEVAKGLGESAFEAGFDIARKFF